MTSVDTTWKLEVDTANGRVTFHVGYHSALPPARHEEIHRALRKQGEEVLRRLCVENPAWYRRPVGASLVVTNEQSRVNTVYELQAKVEKP